jgi:hypothetical protein
VPQPVTAAFFFDIFFTMKHAFLNYETRFFL